MALYDKDESKENPTRFVKSDKNLSDTVKWGYLDHTGLLGSSFIFKSNIQK